MFKVRDVLDRLPGGALIPLSREKGLVISGRVEDFRVGLAKHYGRRTDELLGDLRRSDLSKLFRRTFEVSGVTYRLRNRSRYAKADLLEMALTLFARGEIHEQFSTEDLGEVDEGDEEEAEEAEEEPEEDAEAAEAEEPPAAVQSMMTWLHQGQWSTARPVKRVLKVVYDQEYTQLTTAQFQRLLADLHRYGVQLCFDGAPSSDPVRLDAESPGLDVMVHLRLRAADVEPEEEELDLLPPEADEQIDVDALPVAIRNLLVAISDGAWSRPRTVSRLLVVLYDQEFTRLRTARFHRLLRDLDAYGVELCIADDPDRQPLALDAASLGLDAPVRLRMRSAESQPTDDARTAPQPVVVKPTSATTTAPLQPVRVIPDPGGRISQVPAARTTPYELAQLRLEFLTAAPSVDRAHDPLWPDAFLNAAARGIDLHEREQRYLRLAANSFVSGSHDPMGRVMRLTRVLHPDDWPLLLLDYERLNPDAAPELVNEVLRHASELASLPHEPVVAFAPAPPAPRPSRPEPAPLPRAASSGRHASPPPERDARDLGALKGMFDD